MEICPKCGDFGTLTKNGKTKVGNRQKYICHSCNKHITEPSSRPPGRPRIHPKRAKKWTRHPVNVCPKCGAKELRRHGTSKTGAPRVRCRACRSVMTV